MNTSRYVANNLRWAPYLVFAFMLLSALYVAFFSLYPMAFDEDFHLGLIRIYASSWLPYGIERTSDMAAYGAATADPSYLWHYLLSFPYRLLEFLGWTEQGIIIILRVLNVGAFMLGMYLYYNVFRLAGLSRRISSIVMAFFALIPIVPVLAGQIHYDNFLFIFVALSFYFALRIDRHLKKHHNLLARDIWLLGIVLLLGSAVKYVFLSIAAGVLLWLGCSLWIHRERILWPKLWLKFRQRTNNLRFGSKVLIASGLLVASFFSAHYITNYLQHGSPAPECSAVFSEQACLAYGPWARDYALEQGLSPEFTPKSFPVYLVEDWFPGMATRLTFAVAGPTNDFQTKPPQPIVLWAFIAITLVGIVMCVRYWRYILQQPLASLTLVVTLVYMSALAVDVYGGYVRTGEPVAIDGRYLLPVLPFVGAVLLLAYRKFLHAHRQYRWMTWFAVLGLITLLLGGGGVFTYIMLAESDWYWQLTELQLISF